LIIEIKDSEYVKSISDVHLTFTQMPLVEPGTNNLSGDTYTIELYNVVLIGEDYKYASSGKISQLIVNGSQLTLPELEPINDTVAVKDYGIHNTEWKTTNGSFISGNLYNKDRDGEKFYPTWIFEFKYDLTGEDLLMDQLIALRDTYTTKPFTVSINGVTYNSTVSNPNDTGAFETIEDIEKENVASGHTWISSSAYVEITAFVGNDSFTMGYDWNNRPIGPDTCNTYIVPMDLSGFINVVGNALSLLVSVET
jgi:hypothetical protein